jgi:hypothetical protein
MASNRIVVCDECKKELDVRSAFAHHTLNNHKQREHRNG